MRRKRAEISRLNEIIEKDRTSCSNDFFELVLSDLNKVLREYFEIKEKVLLTADRVGEEVEIKINFSATMLKKFGTIPK